MTKGEPNPVKLATAMFADLNIKAVVGGVRWRIRLCVAFY